MSCLIEVRGIRRCNRRSVAEPGRLKFAAGIRRTDIPATVCAKPTAASVLLIFDQGFAGEQA
jgi:hypothetical protein